MNLWVNPMFLFGLTVPLLWLIFRIRAERYRPRQTLPFQHVTFIGGTWRTGWTRLRPWLEAAVLSLLVLGLARPAAGLLPITSPAQAIDIILAIDVSSSMREDDMGGSETRLAVAQQFAQTFITHRRTDRIGLVTFARFAKAVCPLTFDHDAATSFVMNTRTVEVRDEDGTAIGIGLGSAVRRLRQSEAASKVVILLTDGENNAGDVTPQQAAELAAKTGVRVHTILAGAPTSGFFGILGGQEPDDRDLKAIAEKTGGQYFRARDAEALMQVGESIDKMERTPVADPRFVVQEDRFRWAVVPALLLLLLLTIMEAAIVRAIP